MVYTVYTTVSIESSCPVHAGAILLHWDLLQHKSNNAGVKSPHIHDEPVHYLKAETNKEHERKLRLHTPERSEHNNNIDSVWFIATWVKPHFERAKYCDFIILFLHCPDFKRADRNGSNFKRQQKSIWNTSSSQRLSRSWRKETDFNIEPPFRQRLALKNDLIKYVCMNECQSERIRQNNDIT